MERWIPAVEAPRTEWIFYDGHCGLCHGAVRFVLARDHRARPFHFAPLDSEAFRRTVSEPDRAAIPDSVVVVTHDGRLLTRSDAMAHIVDHLGGMWRVLAAAMRLVPRTIRDAVYDAVARVRRRLFAPPADTCPLVPPELRSRFES